MGRNEAESRPPAASAAGRSEGAGSDGDRVNATVCQFSVYPLRRPRIGDVIEQVVAAAAAHPVTVRVQNMSTLMHGDEEAVFAALRAAYRTAQQEGGAVLVATLAGGMPSDDEVARIQEARVGRRGGEGA